MPKRTYQPKKRSRAREHGFMKRMASKAGQNVLKRRRLKGRTKILPKQTANSYRVTSAYGE